MLLMRSRPALTVVVGSALSNRRFRIVLTTGKRRKLSQCERTGPSVVIASVVVPGVSNFAVIQRVQGASQRVPILFLSTHSTTGSIIRNFRLKNGSCLGGPFNVTRLVVHVGTLLGGVDIHGRRDDGFALKRCAFSSVARALRCYKRGRLLDGHRSRVLGHLYRGGSRILPVGSILLRL